MGPRISSRQLLLLVVNIVLLSLFLLNRKSKSHDQLDEGAESNIDGEYRERKAFDNLPSTMDISRRIRPNQNRHESHTDEDRSLFGSFSIGTKSTVDFRKCRMFNCFNFSRCDPGKPLKVSILRNNPNDQETSNHQSESELVNKKILDIIMGSKYFEPSPEKACLFILEANTLDRDPLSPSFRSDLKNLFGPANNYGMNHLVFNLYSGSWPEYRENDFASLNFGAAILAKASNSLSHHRPGFDISLPLFPYMHPVYSNDSPSSDEDKGESYNKTYFLSFKGKRYVFGHGSETRNNLHHINNDRDVIMLTTCRHGKKWRESSDDRCVKDETIYDSYDFNDLMSNSKFCLTPRGRRLGSFRFLEALSSGCIPVILSDGWVDPFDEIINWSQASIHLPENLLLQMPDMLREVNPETYKTMSENCLKLYKKYFSSMERIILSTLSIVEARIRNQIKKL